ncbi:MAG: virulence factor SrfC family protein [Thermodesulfobacteriota bacterium]
MTYAYRTTDDERLHRRSLDFVRFADDLRQLARDSSLDTESRERLLAETALWSARARHIERSAKLPMSIALFGPSQCGKSYLVNEVAKGTRPALDIRSAGGETFDFLKDLNPPGHGVESTAQVTRFTCFDAPSEDPAFPFHIRLLSATDLVKILANAFAHECRSSADDVDAQQLAEAVIGQDNRAGNGNPFSDVELYDIQHYVTHELSQCPYFARLADAQFWRILGDRNRVATLTDQITLLCWLWGRNRTLSQVFLRCLMVVKKIKSEDLWVERAALIPREEGILYVQNLRTHLRKAADAQVRVYFGNGVRGRLPKSVLAALTAEVCLPVAPEGAHEFMEFCDVLDFPGARARHAHYQPDVLDREPAEGEADKLCEVFLRGKIGYLFDRYTEQRDISSLILCSPPEEPQAGSLPHLAYKWISLTHGPTGAQRRGKPVTLYVVFTKFDMSLHQSVGDQADSNARWNARLKTGFEDFYGKVGDNWPARWDGRPFTNCFWVRNPQVDQLVFRNGNGSEDVREEYKHVLPQMAEAYRRNEYVRRYFPTVNESWATVATPGETGIRHLLRRMSENLRPEQKRMILHADMNNLKDEIELKLKPWLDPSSGQRAEEQAQVCSEALSKAVGRFGRVLESLCIGEQEVEKLYLEAADLGMQDMPREDRRDSGEDSDDDDLIVIGKPVAVKTPRESVEKGRSSDDAVDSFGSAGHFASLVLAKWEEILRDTYGNTALHKRTKLSENWYRTVTEELLKGARGAYDLRSTIALQAKTALAHPLPKASAKAQAMMAANVIDDFVNYLGQAPFALPDLGNEAPKVEGDGFPGLPYMEWWMKRIEDLFVRNSGGPSSDVRALIEFSKQLKIHIEVNGPRLSE